MKRTFTIDQARKMLMAIKPTLLEIDRQMVEDKELDGIPSFYTSSSISMEPGFAGRTSPHGIEDRWVIEFLFRWGEDTYDRYFPPQIVLRAGPWDKKWKAQKALEEEWLPVEMEFLTEFSDCGDAE